MKDEEKQNLNKPLELGGRTKKLALAIISLYTSLPKTTEAQVLGRQVLRSGTSIGAHCREGRRAKSDADFINKLQGALQELDETAYWLDLLNESGIGKTERLEALRNRGGGTYSHLRDRD